VIGAIGNENAAALRVGDDFPGEAQFLRAGFLEQIPFGFSQFELSIGGVFFDKARNC
jgi:hypothetical protein